MALLDLHLPEGIDLAAAGRYLGGEDRALLGPLVPGLLAAVRPRAVWAPLPARHWDSLLTGADVGLHLAGCRGAILLAVTLGSGADLYIRRARVGDVAAGAAADALASALTEQLADQAEAALKALHPGSFLTPRFSPGYGDWPLEAQHILCGLLDTPRTAGISVTEAALLLPRKSVTAVLGVSDRPVTGHLAGCQSCALKEHCIYRKRGLPCV